MKIIYKYLFKKFLGPFALTFLFALFILLMQFLWKYVDDLVGKGLEVSTLLELLFYASAQMVALAAPLAVLLSSLMTFGSLGENYELIAMKTAGISVRKLIMSLSFFVILISCGSFWFSDNVAPNAYFKWRKLLRNIMDQKPTLSIEEGVFYQGFDNYIIRVGKKHRNNVDIYDVLIFDHSKYQGNTTFTSAKRGKMEITDDKRFMLFSLYDGFSWDESTNSNSSSKNPLTRFTFSEQYKKFDISSFIFEKTEEPFYSRSNQALPNKELKKRMDSVKVNIQNNNDNILESFLSSCKNLNNYTYQDTLVEQEIHYSLVSYKKMNAGEQLEMINKVISLKNDIDKAANSNKEYNSYAYYNYASYFVEWLKKYVFAVACLLFFFIGASLGSIVRKGGIGVPLVITVTFFSSYYMLSIFGDKIAKGGVVPVWFGVWLSTLILLPICAFLIYQASVDSALLSSEEINKKILNLKKLFVKNKNENPATHP
ncbi:MAG: LptF/LptG family permease [Bacteroidales bacterium]|nr:LptF/LptG family permease [Bacteroidales bacterium]